MTVLAWDGHTLVADGRTTAGGDIVTDNTIKIYCFKKENVGYMGDRLLALAVAGACKDVDKLIVHMLNNGLGTDSEIKHDVAGIIIGEANAYSLEFDSNWLIRYPKKTLLAEGSGGVWALSALRLGKNSKEAVKHAIANSTSCGGKIREWTEK